MTLIRPTPPTPLRDRPVDPAAVSAPPRHPAPRRKVTVKGTVGHWIAANPGAGLASAAAVGAAFGWLLKRR